tara:strand:+ start:23995 stop:24894 length:900 start_codon:yes stop_codon:yes gene_type:complete
MQGACQFEWAEFKGLDGDLTMFLARPAISARQFLPVIRQFCACVAALIMISPMAAASGFAPHTAHYAMQLLSARSSSSIETVSGDMLVRWEGDCAGWTMSNRTVFDVGYTGGDTVRVTMDATTWESQAGDRYTFLVRTSFNDKETDRIEGTARLDADARVAEFVSPSEKQVMLPPGTVFPTRHTQQVLSVAGEKAQIVRATVFDGFTEGGAQFVNAVIGRKIAAEPPEQVAFPELRSQPSWNVNLAFFPIENQDAEPESEISVKIYATGIAGRMDMDFGDFKVRGDLKRLKTERSPVCK